MAVGEVIDTELDKLFSRSLHMTDRVRRYLTLDAILVTWPTVIWMPAIDSKMLERVPEYLALIQLVQ